MFRLILVLISLFCAAIALNGSPEAEIAAQMDVQLQMNNRYSLRAVGAFLKKIIEKTRFEGVDLSATVVSSEWKVIRMDSPIKIRSGSWVLWDRTPSEGEFVLAYSLADGRSVDLLVHMRSRERFKLTSITYGSHTTKDEERLPEINMSDSKSTLEKAKHSAPAQRP